MQLSLLDPRKASLPCFHVFVPDLILRRRTMTWHFVGDLILGEFAQTKELHWLNSLTSWPLPKSAPTSWATSKRQISSLQATDANLFPAFGRICSFTGHLQLKKAHRHFVIHIHFLCLLRQCLIAVWVLNTTVLATTVQLKTTTSCTQNWTSSTTSRIYRPFQPVRFLNSKHSLITSWTRKMVLFCC